LEGTLLKTLEAAGYRARLVPGRRVEDLRLAIEECRRKDLLDSAFYSERLTGFCYDPPVEMQQARSIIVVAYRDAPVRHTFRWKGRELHAVVPPTYAHFLKKDAHLESVLRETLGPEGCRVAPALVPKKLLATRSGLAAYGRNNITYIDGMGSFYRLAAFSAGMRKHRPLPRGKPNSSSATYLRRNCPPRLLRSSRPPIF
jgi:epoxyqueuosine reductase